MTQRLQNPHLSGCCCPLCHRVVLPASITPALEARMTAAADAQGYGAPAASSASAFPALLAASGGDPSASVSSGEAMLRAAANVTADGVFRPVSINFQPPADADMPAGFRADLGRPFAVRGNGLEYGWVGTSGGDKTVQIVDRNDPLSPKEQYDTLALMPDDAQWQIAVPNGTYYVNLQAGDPSRLDSYYKMEVNGVPAMRGRPQADYHWIEGQATVTVTDGLIRVRGLTTPGDPPDNNKLDFLSIRRVEPVTYEQLDDVEWDVTRNSGSPIARAEAGSMVLGDKLYVMGGYTPDYDSVTNRLDIYDMTEGTWTRGADLPGTQTHAGVASDGRLIYHLAGQFGPNEGNGATADVWKYYPKADRWKPFVSLPEGRYGGTAQVIDTTLYYTGGDPASNRVIPTDELFALDLTARDPQWVEMRSMPHAGDHLSSTVVGGKLYVVGGEHGHGRAYVQHPDLQIYDPATNRWTYGAPLPTPTSHMEGGVFAYQGKVWAIGGQRDAQRTVNELRSYDPVKNIWELHSALPRELKAGVAFVHDGQINYIVGEAYGFGIPNDLIVGTFK